MALHWPLGGEEEALHRQSLFRKARKGNKKAKKELQEVYGVRLFSEQERAKLIVNNPRPAAKRGKRKAQKSRS